jgi:hypothetical protein
MYEQTYNFVIYIKTNTEILFYESLIHLSVLENKQNTEFVETKWIYFE